MAEQDKTKEELIQEIAVLRQRVSELQTARLNGMMVHQHAKLLSAAVEQSSLGVAIVDLDGEILYVNQAFAQTHEYTPEELLGKNLSVFHNETQMASVREANASIKRTGRFSGEVWHVKRDGTEFPAFMENSLLRDNSGTPIAIIGTLRDISDQKRIAAALREEKEKLETLLHAAPFGMVLMDSDGVFLYTNPIFETMFGYRREDVPCGREWLRKAYPDPVYRQEVISCWINDAREMGPGIQRPRVFTVTCADGTTKIVNFRPVQLMTGQHLMTCEDITEQRKTLEALKESEQRLEMALKGADLGLWDWNIQTGEAFVNEGWAEMLGFSHHEIEPRIDQISSLFHPDDRPLAVAAMRDHIRGRTACYEAEVRIRTKSGQWKWILARGKVVQRDQRGRALRAVGTHLDVTQSKRLREERDRLFNLSMDMLCVAKFDGYFRQINPAWTRTLGWSEEELRGRPWLDFVHPDDKERTAAAGDTLTQGQHSFENRYRCKDGGFRWLSWNSVAVPEEKLIYAVARDITGRKKAEEDLAQAQALLMAAIEQSPAGILIADAPDGTIKIANSAALGIRGESALPLTDIPFHLHPKHWQVFRPDGTEFAPAELPLSRAVLEGVSSSNVEGIIRRSDGEERWFLANSAPVRDGQGEIVAGIVVFPDITTRKEAENALIESRQQYMNLYEEARRGTELYRSLLDSSPEAVVIYDMQGRAIYVNQSFSRIFGWTIDELKDKQIPYVPDSEIEPSMAHIRELIEHGTPCAGFETKRYAKDGRLLDISLSAGRYLDHKGDPAGMLVILADITEHKRMEGQLRQAAKMEAIGQLAGGIAHDFNNLLTAISGYSSILLHQIRNDLSARDKVLQISRAADRAAILTKQLLAFSRKQLLDVRVMELTTTVIDFGKILQRLIGEDVELVTILDSSAGRVRADPGQIEQILMNLAANARDAMPRGGRLTIETSNVVLDEEYARVRTEVKPGPYVMLAVSDTGCGMNSEVQARIFEPFYTTKDKEVGTGLGLSTVFGIVKQHQGHIAVYSELGRGTTFKVYLPMVEQPADMSWKPAPAVRCRSGSEMVMVVEDEEIVRTLTCEFLEMMGYKVLDACDPETALAVCASTPGRIDLLVTDVVLPGMDGKTLFERIAQSRPQMKVLYISGYTENFIVHHGVLERGVRFLQKPFTLDGLGSKVQEALEND